MIARRVMGSQAQEEFKDFIHYGDTGRNWQKVNEAEAFFPPQVCYYKNHQPLSASHRESSSSSGGTMFERYTEKARRVIFFARYEASQFGSATIDTEHVLLGILRESPNLLSESLDTIRILIEEQTPIRERTPTNTDLPFSDATQRALNFASEEATQFGHRHIGTEHILLGLLHEKEGLAAKVLAEMAVRLETFREVIPLSATEELAPGSLPELFGFGTAHPKPFEYIPAHGVSGRPVPNAEFNQAIADAIDEARLLLRASARPEHLLLGLLRNERSLATKILHEHGLDLNGVRKRLKEQ